MHPSTTRRALHFSQRWSYTELFLSDCNRWAVPEQKASQLTNQHSYRTQRHFFKWRKAVRRRQRDSSLQRFGGWRCSLRARSFAFVEDGFDHRRLSRLGGRNRGNKTHEAVRQDIDFIDLLFGKYRRHGNSGRISDKSSGCSRCQSVR